MKRDMRGPMLEAGFVRDFEDLLSVERVKLNEQTQRDLNQAVSKYAGQGILQSSMAMGGAADIGARTIPIYAQAALNLLIRTTAAHGIGIVSDTYTGLLALLENHIRSELDELKRMVTDTPAFGGPSASKMNPDQYLVRLDTVLQLELTRIRGEISLIATANRKRLESATETGGSTVIVNGPVGVLQTGPGSFGIANQTVDSGAKEALERAFTALLEELTSDRTNDVTFDRGEVKELIADGQAEIAKPKPNRIRLKGIVTGIADAISFTPKLQSFYATLKWAGGLIGVTLP